MPEHTLRVSATLEHLEEIIDFIESCADLFGMHEARKFGIRLAVEEAVVNICNYAYPDREGMIDLRCSMLDSSFVVDLSDSGIPFDILSLSDPDTVSSIEDRMIGGLGGFFIRKFSDRAVYVRTNDTNLLRLQFNRNSPASIS
ncbi:ATP-binding protein [Chlorobium limicola]